MSKIAIPVLVGDHLLDGINRWTLAKTMGRGASLGARAESRAHRASGACGAERYTPGGAQ